jgi:hypothetical protein
VTIQKVVYRMNRREQNMNEIKTVAEKKEPDDHEICVVCMQTTSVKKGEPITHRFTYVEGVGQLCYNCYRELFKQSKA